MIWFTEYQTENVGLTLKVRQLKNVHSKYQNIYLFENQDFGKVLVLDGAIQTTEKDEFMYHEMLVHPALVKHKNPEKVLVIGGGDGGSVREILKHPSIKQVDLCEIDEEVILISEKNLPNISGKLRDDKVKIYIEDGNEFLNERKNYYDVIIMDSSDPIGPAEVLFKSSFYDKVKEALKEDGIMVAQTESPFLQEKFFKNAVKEIKKSFKYFGVYTGFVPSYPAGMWSYTMASDNINILEDDEGYKKLKNIKTKYINEDIYKSLFKAVPQFIKDMIEEQ
ncbi:polyamine aminopropyltransferase [Hydrogenothermus marinus]|uniref:Polyamine aminopropyltransferase n=1 Tax=Hydrogenothermus marinus TaxID=133270 RepID=A0A3M0C3M4_9AQUI|nr:polyamine aminopropyltransferase [Hydrogenothermus marinus]RMA97562.1 spermidine synthase [Hydrogenothermus marinus]